MVKNYKKLPVTISAIQFDGTWESLAEITGNFPELQQDGVLLEDDKVTVPWFGIKTLEGTMKCVKGDYVIKGIKGEFYPCKPDIFEASYDMYSSGPSENAEAKNLALSFGGKLAGVSFNPSNDNAVDKLKTAAANFMNAIKEAEDEQGESLSMSAEEIFSAPKLRALEAQMLAVKAITWKH